MPHKTTRRKQRGGVKKGSITTAEPIQEAVLAARAKGKSKKQIAQEQGIDRETVTRILNQSEIREKVARARSRLYRAVEKAADQVSKLAEQGDYDACHDMLTGLQVYVPKTQQDSTHHFQDEWANEPDEVLEYYARTGLRPTQEERAYYQVHGRWPSDETKPA